MALTISRNDDRSVPLTDFAADVARRCAAYEARTGRPFDIPRNSGKRRTASKRSLLQAIEAEGGKW